MHNSTEHEIFPVVGILTFMSGKNSILGLSEPKKAKFLDISYLYGFKISCLIEHEKSFITSGPIPRV